MTQDKSVEDLARKLHGWYLDATREIDQQNYNPKAQKKYDDLNEEQKYIDRYIAREVLHSHTQGGKKDKQFCDCYDHDFRRALVRMETYISTQAILTEPLVDAVRMYVHQARDIDAQKYIRHLEETIRDLEQLLSKTNHHE